MMRGQCFRGLNHRKMTNIFKDNGLTIWDACLDGGNAAHINQAIMPAPDNQCGRFNVGKPIIDRTFQRVCGNCPENAVQQSLASFGL